MFKKTKSTVATNEEVISLILAAKDDPEFKSKLLNLLRVPEIERKHNIRQWIAESQERGAPAEFLAALALLHDDTVARKVIDILS